MNVQSKPTPTRFLAAWTPATYSGFYPPYVNITQVGSMARVVVRGDDPTGEKTIAFTVNSFWLGKLADEFKEASKSFLTGFPDQSYECSE